MNNLRILLVLIIASIFQLSAQDTIYYDVHQSPIKNAKEALSYQIITREQADHNMASFSTYYMSGKLKAEGYLVVDTFANLVAKKVLAHPLIIDKDGETRWLIDGTYREYFENGKLKKEIDMTAGRLTGRCITYYENGYAKRNDIYDENSEAVQKIYLDKKSAIQPHTSYFKNPVFDWRTNRNYQTFLDRNYPKSLSIEPYPCGKAIVYLYFGDNGVLTDVKVVSSMGQEVKERIKQIFKKFPNAIEPATCDDDKSAYVVMANIVLNRPSNAVKAVSLITDGTVILYDADGFPVTDKRKAVYIDKFTTTPTDSINFTQTTYLASGVKIEEAIINRKSTINMILKNVAYDNIRSNPQKITEGALDPNYRLSLRDEIAQSRVINGPYFKYFANGNKQIEAFYKNNGQNGTEIEYDINGKVIRKDIYEDGYLLVELNDGFVKDSVIYTKVEEMPLFIGGESALYQHVNLNIRYPVIALENGIQGRVIVRFVVREDGFISNVSVLRGIGGGCDEEAVRIVKKMPKWKPGRIKGRPVSVWYTLPIMFALQQ